MFVTGYGYHDHELVCTDLATEPGTLHVTQGVRDSVSLVKLQGNGAFNTCNCAEGFRPTLNICNL
ncbi:hypothetical protein D3C77_353720 [compost metagenome]